MGRQKRSASAIKSGNLTKLIVCEVFKIGETLNEVRGDQMRILWGIKILFLETPMFHSKDPWSNQSRSSCCTLLTESAVIDIVWVNFLFIYRNLYDIVLLYEIAVKNCFFIESEMSTNHVLGYYILQRIKKMLKSGWHVVYFYDNCPAHNSNLMK